MKNPELAEVMRQVPEAELRGILYIPENDAGVEEGYYRTNEVVQLLRDNCKNPEVVYFIADPPSPRLPASPHGLRRTSRRAGIMEL